MASPSNAATKWTDKDKKQIKILGIIVAVLFVVLAVVLLIPSPKKEYTPQQMAALSVKYVAQNYITGDAKWPGIDKWNVQEGTDSYTAACTMQVKNSGGIYVDHTIKGLTCYNSDKKQWHVTILEIDGQDVIAK
nr:MAG TPA: hypothetical protein [Caudoviricetes sp.]